MPFHFGDRKGYYDANEMKGNPQGSGYADGYYDPNANTGPRGYNMNQNYYDGASRGFGGNPMFGQGSNYNHNMNRRQHMSSDSDDSDHGGRYSRGSSKHRNQGRHGSNNPSHKYRRNHSSDNSSDSDQGKHNRNRY
ncbi:unnamed protein product [Heterobilharzia americana]|nr:unnamed protein product [Heterobilharzia americana]CAH8669144.1 unnamed protein product [Heterobilharzia americana]